MAAMYEDNYTLNGTWENSTVDNRFYCPRHVDDSNIDEFVYSVSEKVIVSIFLPIIFAVGVTGNLAVMYVFTFMRLYSKTYRSATVQYLVSLALADLLYLCSTIPVYITKYISSPLKDDWTSLGITGCKSFSFLSEVSSMVSCITIILVSLERFLTICLPNKLQILKKEKSATVICAISWIAIIIYQTPVPIFVESYPSCINWDEKYSDYPTEKETCRYCLDCSDTYLNYLNVNAYLPLVLIPVLIILYTPICVKLHLKTLPNQRQSVERKRQVIRMLVITIIVYIVCVAPFRIFNILATDGKVPRYLLENSVIAGRFMAYVNSAINPVIYNATCKSYRQAFKQALPSRGKCQRNSGESRDDYLMSSPSTKRRHIVRKAKNSGIALTTNCTTRSPLLSISRRDVVADNGGASNGNCEKTTKGQQVSSGSEFNKEKTALTKDNSADELKCSSTTRGEK